MPVGQSTASNMRPYIEALLRQMGAMRREIEDLKKEVQAPRQTKGRSEQERSEGLSRPEMPQGFSFRLSSREEPECLNQQLAADKAVQRQLELYLYNLRGITYKHSLHAAGSMLLTPDRTNRSGQNKANFSQLQQVNHVLFSERIFALIENEFQVHNIPFDNCLGLGSDNANVMVGAERGVYGRLRETCPWAHLAGCVCHLIHIAAEKGAACLSLNVDQLLIDVYYYLDKSSKRQAAFKDMQLHHDIKENKILKHVSTRWLSVTRCLSRLLENWDALYEFFREQEKNATGSAETERAAKLRKVFQSPTNKLYCLFLSSVLEPFDAINTELQCEEPKVHVLKQRLEHFFRKLLVRFVKPSAILYKHVMDVDFETRHNVKDDKDLLIGQGATEFLNDENSKLREERKEEFFKNVKKFFQTSCKYLKSKLPYKDEVLENAKVADPSRQSESLFSCLQYFLKRFPSILPDGVSSEDVRMEYSEYQCTDITQCIEDRADTTWGKISKLAEDGELLFKVLPRVMVSILCIPHSSAHCERVFSVVRKNMTEFRNRLGHDTLEALLVAKARPGEALQRQYKTSDYADLKSAYYRSLKSAQ